MLADRTFYGVRLPRGFYAGITIRRYRFDTRVFLVIGETVVQLLRWKKAARRPPCRNS